MSSSALIGFGLDSVIEISSAAAVAWQFSAKDPETREKTALRFIAFSFFALAAYVSVDAVLSLLGCGEARPSLIGIVLAAASLVVMPVLSLAQRRAGRELGSLSAVADSKQTLLCTYLSAVLLAGLLLNSIWRLVVGRPRRRDRHRGDGGARGRQRLARGSRAAESALVLGDFAFDLVEPHPGRHVRRRPPVTARRERSAVRHLRSVRHCRALELAERVEPLREHLQPLPNLLQRVCRPLVLRVIRRASRRVADRSMRATPGTRPSTVGSRTAAPGTAKSPAATYGPTLASLL